VLLMPATRQTKDSVGQMRNIVTLALIALPGCWFPPMNYSTRPYQPVYQQPVVYQPPAPVTPACTYSYMRGRYCQTCNGNTICP
jgi:hypothetical protein